MTSELRPSIFDRFRRLFLLAGFCLLIFGAKLWFIHYAGSDLPSWDQWDAEGEVTLRPWVEGWMGFKEIIHPHNEHRLVTTKLYALGLFVVNGQWDVFLESTVNAAIHTASALVLLLAVIRWLPRPWTAYAGGLLLLLFTLPFSWENTLFGFQAEFYFLLIFSLVHLWFSLESDRFGTRWLLGQVCGLLAVLSLASGFFSALAVLAVLGHRFVRERRFSTQQFVTAALAVGFSALGWMLRTEVPGHAPLHAHGPGEFVAAILELLAWPGSAAFPWSLVLFAPAVVFFVRRVRSRTTTPDDALLMGLLAWTVLQCLAIAYGRGGSGVVLSPRYLDLLAINVVVGFVFLIRETSGRIRPVLAAAWLVAVVAGLCQQSAMMWPIFVEPNISRQQRQEGHVRDFLRTGDPANLLDKPLGDVPYPHGPTLVQRLTPPSIQGIMPPSVRRTVPIATGAPTAVPAIVTATIRPIALSTWSVPHGAKPYQWRSAQQTATALPVLRFRIAGDLGDPAKGGRLVVKSAAGEVPVIPDSAPGNTWKNASVFRPPGAWWVEATAPVDGAWFAFTEPVEVGRWSWAAEKLLKNHFLVMLAGALLLAAGGLPELRRRRG